MKSFAQKRVEFLQRMTSLTVALLENSRQIKAMNAQERPNSSELINLSIARMEIQGSIMKLQMEFIAEQGKEIMSLRWDTKMNDGKGGVA